MVCAALLDEELDIQAAEPARYGRRAVIGLAVQQHQYGGAVGDGRVASLKHTAQRHCSRRPHR